MQENSTKLEINFRDFRSAKSWCILWFCRTVLTTDLKHDLDHRIISAVPHLAPVYSMASAN